jgi:hypothetical protein
LKASLDGQAIAIDKSTYRAQSPAFGLLLLDHNLLGLGAGVYHPAVADGYYVLLAPLSRGSHVLKFGGVDGSGFVQDVTYHLMVK